jgi:NADPH:quinone reductase-like Zn-dependent oxidoreductase
VRQVVAERAGGPEVLRVVEAPIPEPGPGEVLIAAEAVGVNFADVWARLGAEGEPPYRPGIEVAGTVAAVGVGVAAPAVGDRVAATPYGTAAAYAERVLAPADVCFPVPDGMPATTAAALPLNYLTAYAAVEHAARPAAGERVLVHAAAGGVGLAAVQLARRHGVEIYATASNAKHEILRKEGVAHPVDYRTADWVAEVMRRSGDGVDIVIDGVGEDRFRRSLSVLRFGGRVVAYGYTAGVTGETEADVDLEKTLSAGVPLYDLLSEARGVIGVHLAAPTGTLRRWWDDLLARHAAGGIAPRVTTLPLAEAAEAHRRLHARENVGKIVLIP